MKKNWFLLFFSIFACYLLFDGISYTDDFSAYEADYNNGSDLGNNDYGFFLLISLCHLLGMDFGQFHNLSIFIGLALIALFLYYLKINVLIGMLFIVILNYVQMANQLRYFIAFPLFLLSVYCVHILEKRKLGVLLCVMAFLFHNGILGVMTFYPIYYFIQIRRLDRKKIITLYVLMGFFTLIVFANLSSYMVNMDDKYESYTTSEMASISGIGYMLLFSFINIASSYLVQQNNNIKDNRENMLLFSLSMFPLIFFIATFSGMQIIVARYVNVFFIVWVVVLLKFVISKRKILILSIYLLLSIASKYGMALAKFDIYDYNNDLVKIALIWQSRGK